jgi:leucyl/phenylalanyl-tRNA---protein transferase
MHTFRRIGGFGLIKGLLAIFCLVVSVEVRAEIPLLHCESHLLRKFGRTPSQETGFITDGVAITWQNLVVASRNGIYPNGLARKRRGRWFSPSERGVLFLDEVDTGRTDRKFLKRALNDPSYEVTYDQDFLKVIEACATMGRKPYFDHAAKKWRRPRKWISQTFIDAYYEAFKRGYAHSVEVRHHGKLVGGLYGTMVDGFFSGESMYHIEDDALKVAFDALINRLKKGGHKIIDVQQAERGSTSLAVKWGAKPISRLEYLRLLREEQSRNLSF